MKNKFQKLGLILTKNQTKKIVGGDDGGSGHYYTCFAQVNGQINAYQSTSFSSALDNAKHSATGHWCCSSCSSASWLQGVVEFRHH